ncbi:MAG: helix-turn-helix domain-containing protein [Maledivibacter sp.]|jgi:transcriptional regulator with XRE-family HTH domain|nr:helix-turn-helix domain-containing protein [Maledivibacter sp.]
MEKFVKRLQILLEEKNINQKELANYVDVTEVTISRYMNGERKPRIEIINKIAEVLDTTTDYLLGRSDIKNSEENKVITRAFHSLDIDGLPDEAIKEVEKYVELIKLKYKQQDKR